MSYSRFVVDLLLGYFTKPKAKYLRTFPHAQAAVDLFKGEWASALPGGLQAGQSLLFDDARIKWFASRIGGLADKSVLELGPLEGGHSYMMESMGASRVVAIEGNDRGYLKCLITKELFHLKKVSFLYGDFLAYLREEKNTQFDVAIASGVLYHMTNPVEMIALLAATPIQHLFLWTHYYDDAIMSGSPRLSSKFSPAVENVESGFRHRVHRQNYGSSVLHGKFCGGPESSSNWLSRSDILAALAHFGFDQVEIAFDEPNHQNGPAFAITATRAKPS